MWSFSDSDLDVPSNHQEHFNTPCIASPFGATAPPGVQRKRSFNHQINRKSNKSMNKKSLHQWLRLQEVHHRIRDCEDENEKFELYISKLFFSALFRDQGIPIIYQNLSFVNDFMKIVWTSLKKMGENLFLHKCHLWVSKIRRKQRNLDI